MKKNCDRRTVGRTDGKLSTQAYTELSMKR